MNRHRLLHLVISLVLTVVSLAGCGTPTITLQATPVPATATPVPATATPIPPTATPTPKPPTPTPTPVPPTPTPTVTTITLQNVHLVYDYLDRRGYMLGGEEATITVNKLPVIIAGGAKTEISFGDIASITMQPSKRQHPEVAHWDIRFLDATVTLRNKETIRCEIGTYLPLPKSGSKPAFEIYNGEAINIRDTYLSGEIVDTGLMTKLSLYDIQAISIDAPGNPPESLGTVIITPGRMKQ
ncbi:hypothetical protein [Kouleothrix sp.]|uniref:hypothetical protein n=1 Tax=Kouleothrix sp. TaxID=2779161 RepID=UPI00391D9414